MTATLTVQRRRSPQLEVKIRLSRQADLAGRAALERLTRALLVSQMNQYYIKFVLVVNCTMEELCTDEFSNNVILGGGGDSGTARGVVTLVDGAQDPLRNGG